MKIIKPHYTNGDTRIRKAFLLFPKTIVHDKIEETRWLVVASWVEVYYWSVFGELWEPIRWVD